LLQGMVSGQPLFIDAEGEFFFPIY